MKIPIRNIYYLLAYAWDHLQEAEVVDVGNEDFKELIDLFARVLLSGTTHMLRRGMARGYESVEKTIPGIRGRIRFSQSLRENTFQQGRANCSFDELSYDILPNQVLRATIRSTAKVSGLDKSIRADLLGLLKRLEPVSDIELRGSHFRQIQLHRNQSVYSFLINICRLIYDNLSLAEDGATRQFRDFVRDDRELAGLFENFVRNFYDQEAAVKGWRGGQRRFSWQQVDGERDSIGCLPHMTTDVTLQNGDRTVILDTKYYSSPFHKVYNKDTFHSSNLYQLFSYLKNYEALTNQPSLRVSGILLYPTVDEDFDHRVVLHGNQVRICSVNLAKDWKSIHERLLAILPDPVSGISAFPLQ